MLTLLKGRHIEVGQRVFVYYNLHKHCFSIKDMKTGLVLAHSDDVTLENAIFKVSEAGRQRVLSERVKNVHAGVVGNWTPSKMVCDMKKRATYNPYHYDSFVDMETLEALHGAECVRLQNKKVYYKEGA
jgi:hypothetical protein